MKSFLQFRSIPTVNQKTKKWDVCTLNGGVRLGTIAWYNPWRRYCFHTAVLPLVFDRACLVEISDFLDNQMESHKA